MGGRFRDGRRLAAKADTARGHPAAAPASSTTASAFRSTGDAAMHRVRAAMQSGSFAKLSGEIEADETFIGGKARDMHIGKRERRVTGTGTKDKTSVLGILERGGDVKPTVVPTRKKKVLQAEARKHVEVGTDLRAFLGYVFE